MSSALDRPGCLPGRADWTRGLPQDRGYLVSGVEFAGGNSHYEVVGGVMVKVRRRPLSP